MTRFSNNRFKKTYFWPIFPILGAKIFFPKNPALSRTTPHGLLTPCWVSGKTNEPILRKLLDKRMEGQKDGQKWNHRTLLAIAVCPICNINQPSYYFRSTTIHSWNWDHIGWEKHGLGVGFLYVLLISQLSVTFFISLFRFIFWCFFYCTVNQGLQFLNRWMCKMVKFCEVKWWSAISLSDLYLMSHRTIWCWLRLLLNLFTSCLGGVVGKAYKLLDVLNH